MAFRYIDEPSITGLTSNPTIFNQAIKNSSDYDAAIREKVSNGKSGEDLFFELAIEDITAPPTCSRPIFDRSAGVDGFVSPRFLPARLQHTDDARVVAKLRQRRCAS